MCTVSWARLLLSKVILNWKYTHILIHMIIQASDIMYTYFSWLSDDPISGLIDISLVNRYSYWSHRTLIMRLTCTLQNGREEKAIAWPAGTIEPSKEKRHCGADDCNEQLVGTSIGHHYRSRTDFEKLKVLRSLWWKGCVQLRRGRSSSTRETRRANWWRGKAGWQIQVMAQPSSLLEKSKIKSPNCHTNFGKKSPEPLVM